MGGTVMLTSRACRERLLALAERYEVQLVPISIEYPIIDNYSQKSTMWFAYLPGQALELAGKVFTKTSLGRIDSPCSSLEAAAAVRAILRAFMNTHFDIRMAYST